MPVSKNSLEFRSKVISPRSLLARRIPAARATRSSTSVSGGSSASATWLKKKDPPQSTERKRSRPQSRRVMVLWMRAASVIVPSAAVAMALP